MPRNPNKDNQVIMNGNRFMVNVGEFTGVFHRDPDKLFTQYKNLRLSIYSQYKGYLSDSVSRMELMSYIDEQFIRLVKEYDIHGAIDFPGYVKNKLERRVKNSYIKGEYRDRKRVFVPKNDFDVTNLLEQQPRIDEELDYYETLEYALRGVDLDWLEKEILFLILQEHSDRDIEKEIKSKFPDKEIRSTSIRENIKRVQEILRTKLKESLEM